MADVIVIGAGISGLAAALRLRRAGADVEVFDRAPNGGGHLRTVQRQGWRHEAGPNSFLGSAAAVHALAEEAGLAPVAANPVATKRFLFLDGALQALPASPFAALSSPLLPVSAKLRLLKEPFTRAAPAETESIRSFFERHFGREPTDRFVDAFVSGIYAGDISQLSMAATFPKLFGMARRHGSLVRALLAGGRPGGAKPAKRGTFSFKGGMGDLPRAIAARLGPRLQLEVDAPLTRAGTRWSFAGTTAPAVIIAAPTDSSAKLLEPRAPDLARSLNQIAYAPMAGIHLLFRRADVPHPLDGFGFLIPRRERVRLLGCIWSSSLFDVCPPDQVALTCFMGGAHDPAAVELDDEALVQQTRADLERTLGIKAAPIDTSVVTHRRAIPQYGLGHIGLRDSIRRQAATVPGLFLAGNWLEGVSMNDAVTSANAAADQALAFASGRREERAA